MKNNYVLHAFLNVENFHLVMLTICPYLQNFLSPINFILDCIIFFFMKLVNHDFNFQPKNPAEVLLQDSFSNK